MTMTSGFNRDSSFQRNKKRKGGQRDHQDGRSADAKRPDQRVSLGQCSNEKAGPPKKHHRDDRYQPMTVQEAARGSVMFHFLFDGSGSMSSQYPFLSEMMRDVAVPGIKGIETSVKKVTRVACSLFSNDVAHGWLGYRSPAQLGLDPLPVNAFSARGLGGATALYHAVLYSLTELERSIAFYKNGGQACGKLLVLTDGAENASNGIKIGEVHARLSKYRDGKQIQSVLVYFETGSNLSERQVKEMASGMGFKDCWFFGSDQSLQVRQREFRHQLKLFSSQLNNKEK